MEPQPSKSGRRASENSLGPLGPSIKLTVAADSSLTKAAKKLGVSKALYASAATSYFTESGLDPRTTSKYSLAKVAGTVGTEAEHTRSHNANIGNRLVAILRTFERNNGQYLQAQQGDMLTYLLGIEEKVLATMLEHLYRIGAEARITRGLAQILILQSEKIPYSSEKLRAESSEYDEQRERQVLVIAEKVAASSKLARPIITARPAVQQPPKPVPTNKPDPGVTAPTSH